jgi:hypothetical protein
MTERGRRTLREQMLRNQATENTVRRTQRQTGAGVADPGRAEKTRTSAAVRRAERGRDPAGDHPAAEAASECRHVLAAEQRHVSRAQPGRQRALYPREHAARHVGHHGHAEGRAHAGHRGQVAHRPHAPRAGGIPASIRAAGGVAGVCRSVEDAQKLLGDA